MINLELQNDDGLTGLPPYEKFNLWVGMTIQHEFTNLEQTIRIVGEDESRALNHQFRNQDKPTNVLSFSVESEHQSKHLGYDYLGDLVICAPVVASEALHQGKSSEAHWAHMVVHGMLHLQGFDHLGVPEAEEMETIEVQILSALGYTNPYTSLETPD